VARSKSPLAFLSLLVKAEVENCDFCALRQDRELGRKSILCCPAWGLGTPGSLLKSRELVTVPRAGKNTWASEITGEKFGYELLHAKYFLIIL